jgi:hypothetical protein
MLGFYQILLNIDCLKPLFIANRNIIILRAVAEQL